VTQDCTAPIGTYLYSVEERERFFGGSLLREWASRYADVLFDEHDLAFAAGPKLQQGKSYFEWRAAILLHELTGFHALVTRYQFPDAVRKQRLLRNLVGPTLWPLFVGVERPGRAQGPDLIMYDPADTRRWFFCETKKGREGFTAKQSLYFPMLAERCSRPVFVLTFAAARDTREAGQWINRPSSSSAEITAAGAVRAWSSPTTRGREAR
jgi:hypothetical protein